MSLGGAVHQKPGQPGRTEAGGGEAAPHAVSDEATLARHAQTDSGAGDLLGQALARENMAAAWKRVKANKGGAGVDARTVQDTVGMPSSRTPPPGLGMPTRRTGAGR